MRPETMTRLASHRRNPIRQSASVGERCACGDQWPCSEFEILTEMTALRESLQLLVDDNTRRGMTGYHISQARRALSGKGRQ